MRPAHVDHATGTARLHVTDDAWSMVGILGGRLHAYLSGPGCRATSLAFTTDEPRRCLDVHVPLTAADDIDWEGIEWTPAALAALAERPDPATYRITVSHDLAPLLDSAVLDFGEHLGMERFVWARLADDAPRRCTCLRSIGTPLGRRGSCLDDARQGLTSLR